MQVIYADTVFLTNLIINYLILLTAAKICAATVPRLRILAAAALGGGYAVASALPPAEFLHNPIIIAAAGIIISVAAFGGQERLTRITLVFFACAAAFAGAVFAVSLVVGGGVSDGFIAPVSFKSLVLCFGVCYAVMAVVFRGIGGNKGGLVRVAVRRGGSKITLRALIDTGNNLRDPLTGAPVVVTGIGEAGRLFPKEICEIISKLPDTGAVTVLERLTEKSCPVRFQLIPYSAIGVSGGMLLAFKPDEITVNGAKRSGMLIALSPNNVSDNGTYTALIGA